MKRSILILLLFASAASAQYIDQRSLLAAEISGPVGTIDLPDWLIATQSPTPSIRGDAAYWDRVEFRIDWNYVREHPDMWPAWMQEKPTVTRPEGFREE